MDTLGLLTNQLFVVPLFALWCADLATPSRRVAAEGNAPALAALKSIALVTKSCSFHFVVKVVCSSKGRVM